MTDLPAPGRRRVSPLLAVLTVLALLLLAAAAILGLRLHTDARQAAARDAALQAARQEALNLTSIDQKDPDGDIQRVLDGASGDFRSDFATRAGDLRRILTANAVSSRGQVLDAGLVRADGSTATAVVVVDSDVRNSATPGGAVRRYRMQLDLQRVGDRWLTSTLQFVG